MAIPHFWLKKWPSNSKTLLKITNLSRSNWNANLGWPPNLRVKARIVCSWVMFVYKLSISRVQRRVSDGNYFSGVTDIWVHPFTYGCREPSVYPAATAVGPPVQETIGHTLRGCLWILGKKYIVCVLVTSQHQWPDPLNTSPRRGPHLERGMMRGRQVGWLVWRVSIKGPQ